MPVSDRAVIPCSFSRATTSGIRSAPTPYRESLVFTPSFSKNSRVFDTAASTFWSSPPDSTPQTRSAYWTSFARFRFRLTSSREGRTIARVWPWSMPSQFVYYMNLASTHGKASDCISCRNCEKACPQHLKVSEFMKDVSATFDNGPGLPTK